MTTTYDPEAAANFRVDYAAGPENTGGPSERAEVVAERAAWARREAGLPVFHRRLLVREHEVSEAA